MGRIADAKFTFVLKAGFHTTYILRQARGTIRNMRTDSSQAKTLAWVVKSAALPWGKVWRAAFGPMPAFPHPGFLMR